jgi:hypothetical protein
MSVRGAAVLAALALVAISLGSALAKPGSTDPAMKSSTAPLYAKMKQRFTTAKRATPTGWSFDGALKPFPAGEQVPPQREVKFVFPRGTRVDLRGVRNCFASDEQIATEGLDACPARSRIGTGAGGLFLGAVGILDVNAYVFAARPQLAAIFTTESGTVLRVLRLTHDRNRVTGTIPPIELPGGYEVAVTRLALKLPRGGTRKHPLLRTPKRCPRKRRWTFVYLPRYDEPYGVQRSTSSTPCRRRS